MTQTTRILYCYAGGRWCSCGNDAKLIEDETPIDDEIQPIETFVESESATDFKSFEALHNTVSTSTTNCFAPMFRQKLDICMMNRDDHLRRLSETLTNWHWMPSVKNSCLCDKWLCMTCSNNQGWTLFFD